MLLDILKRTAAVVSLAAVVATFSAGFAPAVTEAAPPPRGGVRVVHHRPGPRPGYGPHHWRPAPPPRPHYDRHDARRDRRIACGAAAVAVLAALFGGR